MADIMEPSHSTSHRMFKAHKTLPRRRVQANDLEDLLSHRGSLKDLAQSRIVTDALSQRMKTWIPEPAPIRTGSSHGHPLTPPFLSGDDRLEKTTSDLSSKQQVTPTKHENEGSCISTPINQRSPPTPESTPPKGRIKSQMLPPPLSSHDPSSRAESFRTAREDQSSDEDSRISTELSTKKVRKDWLSNGRPYRLKDVGLGLRLESKGDDRTPTQRTPLIDPKAKDFLRPSTPIESRKDGCSKTSIDRSDAGTTQGDNLTNRSLFRLSVSTSSTHRSPSPVEEAATYITKGSSEGESLGRNKQGLIRLSTENFVEQIKWPRKDDETDLDSRVRSLNNRRFSQMSANSAVIEATIFETLPQRKRTLRHTGKHDALRAASSPSYKSNRSSWASDEHPHRLVRQSNKIPDRSNRWSSASDTLASMSSSLTKIPQGSVPVVVVPERRSSLKSSVPNSERHSRTQSLASTRHQLMRPATAPDRDISFFDFPRKDGQNTSEATPPPISSGFEKTANQSSPNRPTSPPNPFFNSSMRPPPSGVTSESVLVNRNSQSVHPEPIVTGSDSISQHDTPSHSQYQDQAQAQAQIQLEQKPSPHIATPGQAQVQVQAPVSGSEIESTRVVGVDGPSTIDWSSHRPHDAQVTPFSMLSMRSSTPGTLEVSEARAVNLYPHNNNSILVIQQNTRHDSIGSERSEITEAVDNISIQEIIAPPTLQASRPLVDSPLRNPRDPPQPPALKIIPPTPANGTPALEQVAPLGRSATDSSRGRIKSRFSSGPIALVKRAMSARRYSENFVSPLSRTLSRRNTAINRRSSIDETRNSVDSKLHAFWRPRGFWDDLSDSESEFGNDGYLVNHPYGTTQQKASADPPTFLNSRRLGSLRHRRKQSLSQEPGAEWHGPPRPSSYAKENDDWGYEFSRAVPESPTKRHVVPRFGYQVQFVGFRDLQDRFEKRKERRVEERRERKREGLRRSIGPVIAQPDARVA